MNGNEVAVSSFDRGDEDAFEQWSEDRAKLIAKVNKKLSRDRLNNTLLSRRVGFDCFNSLGMWVYSRSYNSYSFLPFGYGWRSPYGFSIGTSTNICNYPFYYDRWRPVYVGPRGGGSGNGNGNGNGNPTNNPPQANIDRANRNQTPRYRRMENSGNVEVRRPRGRVNPDSFPGSGNPTGFPGSNRTTNPTTRSTPSTAPPQRAPQQRSPGRVNPKRID